MYGTIGKQTFLYEPGNRNWRWSEKDQERSEHLAWVAKQEHREKRDRADLERILKEAPDKQKDLARELGYSFIELSNGQPPIIQKDVFHPRHSNGPGIPSY